MVQVDALITDGKIIQVCTVCIAYTPNRDAACLVMVEALPSSSARWMGGVQSALCTDGERASLCTGVWLMYRFPPPHNNSETMCHPVLHCEIKGWVYVEAAEPGAPHTIHAATYTTSRLTICQNTASWTRCRVIRVFIPAAQQHFVTFSTQFHVGKKHQLATKCS